VNDIQGDDFTSRFLELAEFGQKVPEAGLGNDGVVCKDAHAVEFGGWVDVVREGAAYDLIFLEATHLD